MAISGLKKAITDYEKNQVIEPEFGKKKKVEKVSKKKSSVKK
jgi:hypothetical protein